jgi:hypothetical protein
MIFQNRRHFYHSLDILYQSFRLNFLFQIQLDIGLQAFIFCLGLPDDR